MCAGRRCFDISDLPQTVWRWKKNSAGFSDLSAVPVDGAKRSLKYLYEKKYCLCAASNGPYDQQINRLKSADMLKYFTHCFVSETVGADKPSRQFFDGCMKELTGCSAIGMHDDR